MSYHRHQINKNKQSTINEKKNLIQKILLNKQKHENKMLEIQNKYLIKELIKYKKKTKKEIKRRNNVVRWSNCKIKTLYDRLL